MPNASHLTQYEGQKMQLTITIDIPEAQAQERQSDTTKAPRYQFAEIPNNAEGWAFVEGLKKYLNRDRYQVLVKGQHITEQAKGRYRYGQPIKASTHLRVYINERGDK